MIALARRVSLIVLAAGLCTVAHSRAQESRDQGQRTIVLATLGPPTYPKVAQVAHITGDMVLKLQVRPDGTVESAIIDSGPALQLLRQAVLESANHSRFDCQNCGQALQSVRLVYSFELEDPASCEYSVPRVAYAENHVTVIGHTIQTCDPATEITQVHSIRCLYLWRCRAVSK